MVTTLIVVFAVLYLVYCLFKLLKTTLMFLLVMASLISFGWFFSPDTKKDIQRIMNSETVSKISSDIKDNLNETANEAASEAKSAVMEKVDDSTK